MGTAVSRNADLSTNEYLVRFVSKEHISPNDPFWNRFLAFNISPPVTSHDQLTLDTRLEPLCQQILSNNMTSGNVGSLIQVFLIRASELLASTNTENNMFAWQTFNTLFLIRCITKYLVETVSEEQLIGHFEVSNGEKGSKIKHETVGKLESFLDSLIELVVDVPLKEYTYAVHLEAINCLLILLSVTLYSQQRADNSTIYRLMMQGRYAIHAPLLIKTLLQHFIDQEKAPSGVYGNNAGNSIVLGIAAELWSIITFNKKTEILDPTDTVNNTKLDAPLANQSLLLILILTNHCTTQVNPYRQSLFSCANAQDNVPIPPTKATTMFKTDYSSLYTSLCKYVSKDTTTLLLYLLLHRNQSFRNYIMTRTDLEQLVIPILKTLYNAPNSNSHHIYMSLIILLILSEDDLFNKTIHETKLKGVLWYTERTISEITLGGLLILVVIRTIQYNMLKMRDKYLHTNCLAALANMSGQFRSLHPYVSQRLVSLFETLAKKYMRLEQQLKVQTTPSEAVAVNVNGVEHENSENLEQDLSVLEEVLRMVLEIFNSCLSNQLVYNPNLIYTLLYKKHIFEPFRGNTAFQDIIHNIDLIIRYYSELLDRLTQSHDLDVQEVLKTIQNGTKDWPKDKLRKFPDLKFKYVEEDQPEEFFIPYVWSLICHGSVLHWSSENIKLFNLNDVVVC
ncbi:uncharacterized protein CBL_08800 [Carabus blaptoides fortunei]